MQIVNIFAILLSLLMVGCSAGGSQAPGASADGLFSLEEIASLEESYGLSKDDLMKQLSITEDDLKFKNDNMIALSEMETIRDLPFLVTYLNSTMEPPGLYGVRFDSVSDLDQKETVKKLFDELSEEAISLYGEIGQGPLTQSDGANGETITNKWKVGEQSGFTLSYSEQSDGIYLSLSYSLIIPGSIHDFG